MKALAGLGFLAALTLPNANAQDTRNVTEPRIPSVYSIVVARLSARGSNIDQADEGKLDTERIQKVLDACPPGRAVQLKPEAARNAFLSGPLELRKGVTLVVAAGATLFASRNPRDYDIRTGSCGIIDQNGHGCKPLIHGDHVENAAVMGDGSIDGRGGEKILGQEITWWQLADQARSGGSQNNPRLIILAGCDNFTLYRITLKNSPNFHVSYSGGNGFTAWGVKIRALKNARNTDGIDPGNSTNVTITNSYIDTGDDQVAIKAGRGNPTTHMSITHNHFYSGHGMSIGSETNGGASAIRVADLSIDGADNGIRIKSNSSRGGLVRDVVYEDVCIRDTKNPIYMDTHYSYRGASEDQIPLFQEIALRNVRILGSGKLTLDGFDSSRRLSMLFDNVTLDSPAKMKISGSHASLTYGPGPVNFRPTGEDIAIQGEAHDGAPNSCTGKFVPFPEN
jgi:polygalacturonase